MLLHHDRYYIMVNLVIVSHSRRLAEGVKELAGQMTFGAPGGAEDVGADEASQTVQIAVAAGIPDVARGSSTPYRLGSDALYISKTIDRVWTPAGVLILVDLGSAVMNTEMAIELLPPEKGACCLISNAPLVEGAVTAALEASLGHDLATVNQAAESAGRIRKVSGQPE